MNKISFSNTICQDPLEFLTDSPFAWSTDTTVCNFDLGGLVPVNDDLSSTARKMLRQSFIESRPCAYEDRKRNDKGVNIVESVHNYTFGV
jgi:hypothetical protein